VQEVISESSDGLDIPKLTEPHGADSVDQSEELLDQNSAEEEVSVKSSGSQDAPEIMTHHGEDSVDEPDELPRIFRPERYRNRFRRVLGGEPND
jgi:hypothetical protein